MSARARVPSTMPAAIRTGQSWPAEYPVRAAVPTHSRVRKAPMPMMTRLASHGVSFVRAQAATVAISPGEEPDGSAGSFSLASCAWPNRANAPHAGGRGRAPVPGSAEPEELHHGAQGPGAVVQPLDDQRHDEHEQRHGGGDAR